MQWPLNVRLSCTHCFFTPSKKSGYTQFRTMTPIIHNTLSVSLRHYGSYTILYDTPTQWQPMVCRHLLMIYSDRPVTIQT